MVGKQNCTNKINANAKARMVNPNLRNARLMERLIIVINSVSISSSGVILLFLFFLRWPLALCSWASASAFSFPVSVCLPSAKTNLFRSSSACYNSYSKDYALPYKAMPAYWYENPSMSVMLLKRCPAKYHLLHSHWHKVKRQKYIILYNIADTMLLTNVYPDSHPLIPILFDFFHLYNNQRRKRLHYLFRILEFIHIQKNKNSIT